MTPLDAARGGAAVGGPDAPAQPAPGAAPSTGAPPAAGEAPAYRPPPPALSGGPRMGNVGAPSEKSKDFGKAVRRLFVRLTPERARAVAVLLLATASVTLNVVGPRLLGHGTDLVFRGIRSGRGIDFPALHRTLVLVTVVYVCASVLHFLQGFTIAGIVQRTMYRLRADVEDKLARLPLSHVDRLPRGDLLSRVTNDIDNVSQSLQQTLSQLLGSVLTVFGVLVMMATISLPLALVSLVTIPLTTWTIRTISGKARGRFIAQWKHTGQLNAQVEEAFNGHSIVKAFGRQAAVEEQFRATNNELHDAGFAAQLVSGCVQPATMLLGNANFVAIAVIGGLRVSSGAMSLGDVQAFIQYSRQFTQPLSQFASMMNVLQSGVASVERVFELLDAPEERPHPAPAEVATTAATAATAVTTATTATTAGPVSATVLGGAPTAGVRKGRVEFEHVAFSYDPARPLIDDLSLVAEPGRTVAIVGPTGAGKTTLVNLLMRFYELDGGRILIDGRDIATMARHELRSGIGMVLQDTWLFAGTIRDNIAYGNLAASEADLLAAAKATYVDRFVRTLPDGYETRLDDDGSTLSAGEKQLLTIARAFLADPAILVLDEATSSVDTRTEVLIQRAMAALRADRTSFVIAHRLSTIRDADTILVMDGGAIVEQGSHDVLIARRGAYYHLYNAQFAGAAAST